MEDYSNWYEHKLNPVAFSIGGEAVPWYWLNYLAGFFWCWYWLNRHFSKNTGKIRQDDISAFMTWGWFGMLIGARVGYILFYNLNWYMQNKSEIIAIWNGGMSFHGGLIGAAISCWVVANSRRVDLLTFTDALTIFIPWPLATGRFCNFLNGELPGRPTDIPWAVVFPAPWHDFPRHPSQLYEAFSEGVLLGIIMLISSRKMSQQRGLMSAIFLAGYGGLRFLTEFTREPDPQIGLIFRGWTLGQLLCLVMVLFAILLLQVNQNKK